MGLYVPLRRALLGALTQESLWAFPSWSSRFSIRRVSAESGSMRASCLPARPLTRQRFYQLVKDLCARVGLDPSLVSPHTFRHAFATHLVEGGVDLLSVQAMLGHTSITTTQLYTHVAHQRLVEAVHAHHPLSRSSRRKRGSTSFSEDMTR